MNRNVMIVDDDPSVQAAVKRILEREGIIVTIADGGEECLQQLREGFRGLILMDVIMPQMDGWDTIKEIVDQGFIEGVIICMLTGKEVPDKEMDTLKEYVLDYITKPLGREKLLSVVEEYLSYLK